MFLFNKYTKWYYRIIDHRLKFSPSGYSEKHHILPKSLGGINASSNLVKLTAREHFICHILLTKMVEGKFKNKMVFAAFGMTRRRNRIHQREVKINSRTYQNLRQKFSKALSELHHGRKWSEEHRRKMSGENHPFFGKPGARTGKKLSKAQKLQMSGENHPMFGKRGEANPRFGTKHSEEAKLKISMKAKSRDYSYLKGRKLSAETKAKISASRKALADT